MKETDDGGAVVHLDKSKAFDGVDHYLVCSRAVWPAPWLSWVDHLNL